MFILNKESLTVEISEPGSDYRGTRFDWSGMFHRIVKDGYVFVDSWSDVEDIHVHDHVRGPSEEFVTVDFYGVEPGSVFVKPGVGLLMRPDVKPYDWFRLYPIVDEGHRDVEEYDCGILFRHVLDGRYSYEKIVELLSGDTMRIAHRLSWNDARHLEGFAYNHNFLTFGGVTVGPGRKVDFPYTPAGNWRNEYDNVALTDHGIRFNAPVAPPSVYMGDLHSADGYTPYSFHISEESIPGERPRRVSVYGSTPLHHVVFWSNPRVACVEPYMPLRLGRGETAEWSILYVFD